MRDSANELSAAPGTPQKVKALSCVAILAVLVATLWPFNPWPRNEVTWIQGSNGLRFQKAGLVISDEDLRIADNAGPESYTLELLLRPASIRSPHTVLTFFRATDRKQLIVRQWRDGLLVTHDFRAYSDSTGKIKFGIRRVFRPARLVFIAVASGPHGTTLYIDGKATEFLPRFEISPADLSGEIVLGTSPAEYDPWTGELRGFAVYAKELSAKDALQHYHGWIDASAHQDLDAAIVRYTFAEGAGAEIHNQVASEPTLKIPPNFSVPQKRFLESPAQEFRPDWSYLNELWTNIAGFVPLGIILCSFLAWTRDRWSAMLTTILSCGILSLIIEVLQYYIPKRGSGVTDIITNTIGGALGALLAQSLPVRKLLVRFGLHPAQN